MVLKSESEFIRAHTFKAISWMCLLILTTLGGCNGPGSAAPKDVISGEQPGVAVNSSTTSSEKTGPNEFRIELLRTPVVEKQENSVWCWAASSAALLNYDKVTIKGTSWSQDEIIRLMAAHKSDQSADEQTIAAALIPGTAEKLESAKARYQQIVQKGAKNPNGYYQLNLPQLPNAYGLVDAIAKGDPVILAIDPDEGDLGHVVVVTGVKYSMAATDQLFGNAAPYAIWQVDAIDPHTGLPAKFGRSINPGEKKSAIDRISFAISRRVAKEYITACINAYNNPTWVSFAQQSQQNKNNKTIKVKF